MAAVTASKVDDGDGLDSLLHELATQPAAPARAPSSSSSSPSKQPPASPATTAPHPRGRKQSEGWDDWEEEEEEGGRGGQQHSHVVDEARIAHYEQELKAYILDLADPGILLEIQGR